MKDKQHNPNKQVAIYRYTKGLVSCKQNENKEQICLF